MAGHFVLFLLLCISHLPINSGADVDGLRAFKLEIEPASIPPTSCLATWNFSEDPCAAPRTTAFTCGVTCSGGRVVQLTLDSQGYCGELTPLISEITQLVALELGENNFHGTIPSSVSSLVNLRTLILRGNSFSGAIPPSIAAMKSLEFVDIARNSLSGAVPGMESLVGLTRLDLSYNNLSGPLPGLPWNLKELALKANSLSGSLPRSSFEGLIHLMVVELSHNNFTGKLESWLFLLPSLQQLNLAGNSLTSIAVPTPQNSGAQLVAVDLSYNKIEGTLPEKLAEYTMLRSLSLSNNLFRGPIPWQYGKKATPFLRLYLDGNYLTGSPPAELFSVVGPVAGSLGDNCLQECPASSELCSKAQKSVKICQQTYSEN